MLTSAGLTLALSVGIGIGLGIWLDKWLHTRGLLVILGTIIGVIAGFKQLIQIVIQASREEEAESEERNRHEP